MSNPIRHVNEFPVDCDECGGKLERQEPGDDRAELCWCDECGTTWQKDQEPRVRHCATYRMTASPVV